MVLRDGGKGRGGRKRERKRKTKNKKKGKQMLAKVTFIRIYSSV